MQLLQICSNASPEHTLHWPACLPAYLCCRAHAAVMCCRGGIFLFLPTRVLLMFSDEVSTYLKGACHPSLALHRLNPYVRRRTLFLWLSGHLILGVGVAVVVGSFCPSPSPPRPRPRALPRTS